MGIIISGILLTVIMLIYLIAVFNKLVLLKQKVKNSWTQTDLQLQRRFDLIPNLVQTARCYMNREEKTLSEISRIRALWANAGSVKEKVDLDNQLSSALKTVIAVSEKYPELKANHNFSQLRAELRNTESKISFSRQLFNDCVMVYNTKVQGFPSKLIAGMLGFKSEELFKSSNDHVRVNPRLAFN